MPQDDDGTGHTPPDDRIRQLLNKLRMKVAERLAQEAAVVGGPTAMAMAADRPW
jgi:hypothetical protein